MQIEQCESAAVFGASGGIGSALCAELAGRGLHVWAASRSGRAPTGERITPVTCDLLDEGSVADAAERMKQNPPQLVIVATGVLTLEDGTGPERSYRHLDPDGMAAVFRLNTIGPALVAKYLLPLLPRDRDSAFAAMSARVGSISDNRLGGWHSYRSSKAALNMLVRNFAIELGRKHARSRVVALHPGTVDTALSKPFQANLPEGQLVTPQEAAANLLRVIEGLSPADSGKAFDWKGEEIPS